MKRTRIALVVAVIALLAVSALSISAAPAAATVTITETQVNGSFRVTNPVNRRVTNVRVDLQPGQAVVNATITIRAPRGNSTTSYQTVSTWTPSIVNGYVRWTLTSATANGAPASTDLITQINTSIGASWRAYWRGQHPGRATAITVDDTRVVITYS